MSPTPTGYTFAIKHPIPDETRLERVMLLSAVPLSYDELQALAPAIGRAVLAQLWEQYHFNVEDDEEPLPEEGATLKLTVILKPVTP